MSEGGQKNRGVHPAAAALDGDEAMTQRLREWGAWLAGGAKCGAGFPTKSVLHQSWMPPAPGTTPSMKAGGPSDRRERELHALIGRLTIKLANALVVVFVHRVPPAEQALRLDCQQSTVRARVGEARRQLRQMQRAE